MVQFVSPENQFKRTTVYVQLTFYLRRTLSSEESISSTPRSPYSLKDSARNYKSIKIEQLWGWWVDVNRAIERSIFVDSLREMTRFKSHPSSYIIIEGTSIGCKRASSIERRLFNEPLFSSSFVLCIQQESSVWKRSERTDTLVEAPISRY